MALLAALSARILRCMSKYLEIQQITTVHGVRFGVKIERNIGGRGKI